MTRARECSSAPPSGWGDDDEDTVRSCTALLWRICPLHQPASPLLPLPIHPALDSNIHPHAHAHHTSCHTKSHAPVLAPVSDH